MTLAFVAHAAFLSLEEKQPVIDPQTFVPATSASTATDVNRIAHVAGVRNALMVDIHRFRRSHETANPRAIELEWMAECAYARAKPTSIYRMHRSGELNCAGGSDF